MPAEKDHGEIAVPINEGNNMGFVDVFPTETRGNGLLRPNNVRTGAAQGKGGTKKKAYCQQCGFPVNLNTVDYSGGSLDGDGAGGNVTETTSSGTMNNGDTYTDYYGEQAHKKGAGCPMCFSKNSSKTRNITQAPTPRPYVGF